MAGWEKNPLERCHKNEMKVRPTDSLGIHVHRGKVWLHVTDGNVWDIVRLYDVTDDQLRALYEQIGRHLGIAQPPTIEQLWRVHEAFTYVLQMAESPAPAQPGTAPLNEPPPDEQPDEPKSV
jgi:hypothetical protein